MRNISFDSRVAIVTGAGRGLGRTYALDLARRGAAVVVNDSGGAVDGAGDDMSAAHQVVEEIKASGGKAVPSCESVTTPEGGQAIVQTAVEAFGRVDVVINNAGNLRDKGFMDLEWSDLEAVVQVHLMGAFYVSQPAFRVMQRHGYGRFIFTSSTAAVFGNSAQANYAAAKMGLVGLSNVLAIEGAHSGILSNVIMPVARTRMNEKWLGLFGEKLDPELVTPLVIYLASEACSLSHEVFSAGGGRFARVFLGLTPGWYAGEGARPSAEDIAAHLEQIERQEGYIVPTSAEDELQALRTTVQTQ